ncbi:DUF2461 domain-containing protein [Saccharicrinis fermentans]|uniref:TIGR02453 family protein n=1 Tax=Saccharicrinis fermentans DSM 9555 = JCM 21142 TaxID=869213 RepID=W7YKP7_9BACT|nr:DUF2461 domain-containing protein [Saccharicrinis fermentans]GAF02934.1 hypothetical protein JCM21142_41584 [Saccharicrinis fermentans DSM 9555 = JCM 21142]
MIPKEIFDFLVELSIHNNREWFQDNKPKYLRAKEAFEAYTNKLIALINTIDPSIGHPAAKDCVFRIYRDARFSKNKDPYKNNFGAYISHGGRKSTYAGYYFHLEPDNSFIGGGIYCPSPKVLKSVREAIIENTQSYKSIIEDSAFKKVFPEIWGERLKTAPKGFDKTDPNIHLVQNKSYTVISHLSDEEVLSENIDQKIEAVYRLLHPFNKFINQSIKRSLS